MPASSVFRRGTIHNGRVHLRDKTNILLLREWFSVIEAKAFLRSNNSWFLKWERTGGFLTSERRAILLLLAAFSAQYD